MKIRDLFKRRKKKEEPEIPEEWKTPGDEPVVEPVTEEGETNPTSITSIPTKVEPQLVYDEPKRGRRKIRIPGLYKAKRVTAFILLVANVVGGIGIILTNPVGLIYFVPTIIILLDYLLKTPRRSTGKWYKELVDNIEEEEK